MAIKSSDCNDSAEDSEGHRTTVNDNEVQRITRRDSARQWRSVKNTEQSADNENSEGQ